jgi:VIT1/CCC1 family predicted Fe2+/Mn2+ transporter
LLVPLGVVTGLAGASATATVIIVGGIAEAAAGALAMGTGSYLASRAENQLFNAEISAEETEVERDPDREREELEVLLLDDGLDRRHARIAAEAISRSRVALLKTMVEKELGLTYGRAETELGDAAVVGASYAVAALIPLWPYFFWSAKTALPVSLVATGLALFLLGVVKGKVARLHLVRSGLEVLLIGGISAGLGYLIGSVGPRLVG